MRAVFAFARARRKYENFFSSRARIRHDYLLGSRARAVENPGARVFMGE